VKTTDLTGKRRADRPARFRIPAAGKRSPPPEEQEVGRPVRHPGDVIRVVLGTAVLGGTIAVARHGQISRFEVNLFRLINQLPSVLDGPMWLVMQGGALAAVFVTSAAAALVRRWRLARDLLVSGMLAWAAAKLVKVWVGRARPDALLHGVILRHGASAGMGFPSGHVAVAAALATAAAPYLPRRYRRLLWVEVLLVAVARVYVGAHLPLDTLAGAALGWTIASAVHLVWGAPGGRPTLAAVRRGLTDLGLPVSTIQVMSADARGSTPFLVSDDAGRLLFAKVVGQQQRDADWLFRAWRYLFYRRSGDEAPFGKPKQLVEHEACLSLLASRVGVRRERGICPAAQRGRGGGRAPLTASRSSRAASRSAWPDPWRVRRTRSCSSSGPIRRPRSSPGRSFTSSWVSSVSSMGPHHAGRQWPLRAAPPSRARPGLAHAAG